MALDKITRRFEVELRAAERKLSDTVARLDDADARGVGDPAVMAQAREQLVPALEATVVRLRARLARQMEKVGRS